VALVQGCVVQGGPSTLDIAQLLEELMREAANEDPWRRRNNTLPEVASFWCLSTGHMTQEDSLLLGGKNPPILVAVYDEGFFVYCDDDPSELLSPELRQILHDALREKIYWVRFDADGPTAPSYTLFDW